MEKRPVVVGLREGGGCLQDLGGPSAPAEVVLGASSVTVLG